MLLVGRDQAGTVAIGADGKHGEMGTISCFLLILSFSVHKHKHNTQQSQQSSFNVIITKAERSVKTGNNQKYLGQINTRKIKHVVFTFYK